MRAAEANKALFSIPEGVHYLNCAYMSPLSRRVVEAGVAGIQRKVVPSAITSQDFFAESDRLRALFARLVHAADPARVAIVPSVSYGAAVVARNLRLEAGANVVVAHEQFPSNVYVWSKACARAGAELRTVAPPSPEYPRAERWNQRLLEAIDHRTALVALGQVHWADGTCFDLDAVAARARACGAALVVDGTQSVGALALDVERLQPDALLCAGYKWLMGPYSLGLAYFGPRFDDGEPLEETPLGRHGSEDFTNLVTYASRYQPGAYRFDVGERANFILVPMLIAALEQVLAWGPEAVPTHCRRLTAEFFPAAAALGFTCEADRWRAPHLFGLHAPAGLDLAAVSRALRAREVHVSVRGRAIRVSPHVYNEASDLIALLDVLTAQARGQRSAHRASV